jgi:tRNA G37 N-methylase Trm5
MRFLNRFFKRDAHAIKNAELKFPDDGFRSYPTIHIEFRNGLTYKVDVQRIYDQGLDLGKFLERERVTEIITDEPAMPKTRSKAASFDNIAFETGVLAERKRIIKQMEEGEQDE